MMGQATCGTGAVPEGPPRCRWGSATEHPCPREATETSWHDVGAEPTTCAEHFVAGEIGREEDDWLEAEYYLERWLGKARKRGTGNILTGALERALAEVEEGKRDWHKRLDGALAVANSYKPEE